tara:strand:+ start:1253 stop:1522 length:270 start_codon:yes stop_codon:yes gene_type:complete
MSQFKFECVDDDNVVTTKTFDTAYLQEAVENVQDFLHGCGFVFNELTYTKNQLSNDDGVEISNEDTKVLLQELVKKGPKSTITDWTASD